MPSDPIVPTDLLKRIVLGAADLPQDALDTVWGIPQALSNAAVGYPEGTQPNVGEANHPTPKLPWSDWIDAQKGASDEKQGKVHGFLADVLAPGPEEFVAGGKALAAMSPGVLALTRRGLPETFLKGTMHTYAPDLGVPLREFAPLPERGQNAVEMVMDSPVEDRIRDLEAILVKGKKLPIGKEGASLEEILQVLPQYTTTQQARPHFSTAGETPESLRKLVQELNANPERLLQLQENFPHKVRFEYGPGLQELNIRQGGLHTGPPLQTSRCFGFLEYMGSLRSPRPLLPRSL